MRPIYDFYGESRRLTNIFLFQLLEAVKGGLEAFKGGSVTSRACGRERSRDRAAAVRMVVLDLGHESIVDESIVVSTSS